MFTDDDDDDVATLPSNWALEWLSILCWTQWVPSFKKWLRWKLDVMFQDRQTVTAEFPSKHASTGGCTGRQWHPTPSTWLHCSPCGNEQDTAGPWWTTAWAIFCPSSVHFYDDSSWRSTYPSQQPSTFCSKEQEYWTPGGCGCPCSLWCDIAPNKTRVRLKTWSWKHVCYMKYLTSFLIWHLSILFPLCIMDFLKSPHVLHGVCVSFWNWRVN